MWIVKHFIEWSRVIRSNYKNKDKILSVIWNNIDRDFWWLPETNIWMNEKEFAKYLTN